MSSYSKSLTILSTAFLAGTTLVSAHGHVAKWTVGGVEKAGFNPSNPSQYGPTAERPTDNSDQGFADYTSKIVACGGASAGSGLETWDVNAGDSITATWNTWPDSHAGPITEYMAACPASGCDGVDASSLKWFKIQEDLFDGTEWPGKAIAKTLDWSFKIPSHLAAGPYLIRHDILAMHSTGAPQVYPVCIQANLISSGSAVPTDTTTFPEAYNINDDFKTWSLYGGDQSLFVNAGPAVYKSGGSGSTPAPTSAAPSTPAETSAPAESSAPAETSAPAVSSAPVESSVEAPVPTTTDATVPAESSAAPEESAAPTTTGAPVETSAPVESEVPTSAPAESSEAPSATSDASTPAPTSGTPGTPGTVELGGPVPPITQNGNRWNTLGGSYFDEQSAVNAACMEQMNRCKRWANGLPNSEVSAALNMCDAQETTCQSAGASQKRALVVERYAKRGLRLL